MDIDCTARLAEMCMLLETGKYMSKRLQRHSLYMQGSGVNIWGDILFRLIGIVHVA